MPLQRFSILNNSMKNVEKQGAAKKYKSMLNDWVKESHKRNRKFFYEYQNHILTLLLFSNLYYIKQETILKRLQDPCREKLES